MSTSRIRYDKDRNGVDVKAAAQIKAQRQPDGQFQSPNTKYPALIFEVAFSQNPGNFAKIAEGYMERSGVNTKTFIGINIDYKSRYPSTLSLWKAVNAIEDGAPVQDTFEAVEVIASKPFRDASGAPCNPDHELRLSLQDIATGPKTPDLDAIQIAITYDRLCKILDKACRFHAWREDSEPHAGFQAKHQTFRRKRSPTPPDCILPDDEAR
ncbi:hypothetical protein UCRPA7_8489 [Phaeoacremonium minimum UCRPA7]|uniref:Uncharacterized protein n=1 Tax=Phaeoacremonium minimum (strain UCR-PA7) TaxID=1286976 RepID=R8B9P8_PHAM7|nr:hypothetical protein UCRPA7_8489 [Phaeoacremonium minimum UCRPA7]EON96007.1 hypothetical protein UCRPA7_8489 [Phaeoacremonium minimum UCRPA7]